MTDLLKQADLELVRELNPRRLDPRHVSYVFAPYIPVPRGTVKIDDAVKHGVASRYAKKIVSP